LNKNGRSDTFWINAINPKKEVIVTTQDKLVKRKPSLLELAEFLKNVSQVCKINGVSRQQFYDIKRTYAEHGIEGLKEKSVSL